MKSILITAFLLLIPKLVFPQISNNDKIIQLDSTHFETKSPDFKYYRIIKDYKLEKEIYTILDYSKEGKLLTKINSKSRDSYTREGEATYYYENGNIKHITNFIKGRPNGKTQEWYENGNKKMEGEYIESEQKFITSLKINQFWSIDGTQKVTDGNGEYEEIYEKNNEKNQPKSYGSGKIKNGFKDGLWQGWVDNPKTKYDETYENGKLILGKITDENNIEKKYTLLEKKPEPKNGIMAFYQYVGKNYKTPNVQGLKGKIYVTFVVDVDGKIIEPRVLRDIGYGTGDEAIRILKDYNGFIPGEQRGRKVKCKYSLPITIQSAY